MKTITKTKQIRISTVINAVKRMGNIPGLTDIELDRLEYFPEYFTEIVRQSAYTLARYKYVDNKYLNIHKVKYITLKEVLNEVLFTVDKCAESFHVLIALKMIAPKIYSKIKINYLNPEDTILPLVINKATLPPRHVCIPRNRYYAELDDLKKIEKGFSLIIDIDLTA